MSYLIHWIKKLPRFEGSHTPNESNHEYIKRTDEGRYILLEDVLGVLENNLDNNSVYDYDIEDVGSVYLEGEDKL